MDVTLIEENRDIAKQLRRDYLRAMRISHSAEDRRLYLAYKELAKGRKLIDVAKVIADAGVDEKGRPKLALSRADWPMAFYTFWNQTAWFMAGNFWPSSGTRLYRKEGVGVRFPDGSGIKSQRARAIVPIIPPRLRPADELEKYHILWEADWQDAPKDPLLLQRVTGDLFAVLAVWDLTEIERAVIRGRATR